MAVYTGLPTVVTGDLWAASDHNTYIRDNFTYFYDREGQVASNAFNARLTLSTGVAIPTSDLTAQTTVYLTPYRGYIVSVYDGSARWTNLLLNSDISIKLTDTQTGTTANTNNTITGLTDTSQLAIGMNVTGTGIPASTTITAIPSTTSVQMNNNATASGSVAITFKVPASKPVDIFVINNSGSPKLQMKIWTNDTTRATAITLQNGSEVLTGSTTWRLCGTVRTTTTDGQCEFSLTRRLLSNVYNRSPFEIRCLMPSADYTLGTSVAERAANSNTTEGQGRLTWVSTLTDVYWIATMHTRFGSASSDSRNNVAIALDSTNTIYGQAKRFTGAGGNGVQVNINAQGFSVAGFHFLQMIEGTGSGGGFTVNAGISGGQDVGMEAYVWL